MLLIRAIAVMVSEWWSNLGDGPHEFEQAALDVFPCESRAEGFDQAGLAGHSPQDA